jgi:hypothetical protein
MAVLRDRIVQLMIVLMALGTVMSIFLGSAATLEDQAFTIATAGTVLRTMAMLGLIIFISFFLRRAFDSREIDYLLATPLTRHRLLISFAVGFILVALVLTGMITIVIGFLLPKLTIGWVYWCLSVAVELIITAMIGLFFAVVLRSATIAALCSLGYYTLARMMGMMIGIVQAKLVADQPFFFVMSPIVKVISIITPRFDLLAQSAWLVYGEATDFSLLLLVTQLIVFVFLFFVCAAHDLRRVQF